MLLSLLALSFGALHSASASPATSPNSNRACVEFFIPLKVSAQNAVYNIPRVDSNIDATEYAVEQDTWPTPAAPKRIKKNITIQDTFSIHAQLCIPSASEVPKKSSFLQIATHGLVFDKRYWDASISPSQYSYVDFALAKGYSILTYPPPFYFYDHYLYYNLNLPRALRYHEQRLEPEYHGLSTPRLASDSGAIFKQASPA